MCNYDKNKMDGYILLFRSLINKWEWYRDVPCKILFLHLLLKANYEDTTFQNIYIKRGSLISSIRNLSYETGLTISQIRTAIKKLTLSGEIATKSQAEYTVITVLNYEAYQANNTPKKIKKESSFDKFTKPTIDEVNAYCIERKNNVDANKWYSYYESNGWKVGKNQMKNWKAAVRTWEKSNYDNNKQTTRQTTYMPTVNFG